MFNKINKKFLSVLSISLLAHIIGGIILGTFIVIKIVTRTEETFEAPPPPVKAINPPKTQYQVSLEKLKNKTSSAKLNPIVTKQISNLNVPSVDVVISSSVDTSFSNATSGLGEGFSSLSSSGGINFKDIAEVKLFGIETSGEKFFFLIDASANMLIDARGGILGYAFVKDRIKELIDGLPSGVLFNVAFYDKAKANVFSNTMLRASPENKEKFTSWITPFNKDSFTGPISNNGSMSKDVPPLFGSPRFVPKVLNIAMNQNPDTIFLLSPGWGHSGIKEARQAPKNNEGWRTFLKEEYGYSDERIEKYLTVVLPKHKEYESAKEQFVKDTKNSINNKRKKKGLPPRVFNKRESLQLGKKFQSFEEFSNGMELIEVGRPATINKNDVDVYIKNMVKKLYLDKDLKEPVLHTIGFFIKKGHESFTKQQIKKEDEDIDWLKRIARKLDGKFEEVRLASMIR